MPRGERPLDAGDSPLLTFAAELRSLRDRAGGLSYRQLGARAHYSATTLSDAAGGRKLPTLAVTLAYVRACDGDAAEWEERWRRVAAEVLPSAEPGPDEGHPPYAGLAAYGTEDAEWFFGRDLVLDELEKRLTRRRFVAVFGASGAGKSSLLRAGLVPRFTGRAAVVTPSGSDVRADRLDLDVDLLIVDQFEEVFTLCPDVARRTAYIDALLTADCTVVLGVRADFYGHCAQHPELVEAVTDGQLLLGPMGPEELRQVIMQPAVKASCTVETALVSRLVADATGQAGVLPLMSHALLETWRRRRGTTLTLAGYEAAGGVQHALAQTAERTFTSLDKSRRALARQVFLRLTALGDGTEDTKRRLPRAELDPGADVDLVLDRLAHARLLTLDRDGVEIAHEALIRSWPRLRGWLAEDRDGLRTMRQLTEAAATWASLGRDPDALYRGTRLDTAVEWTQRDGVCTSTQERAFLAAGLAARDQERLLAQRRTRRLRQLVALLAVLLMCSGTAVFFAIRAQDEANEGWRSSAAWSVSNQSQALRGSKPGLADQLALTAYRLNPTEALRDGVLAANAARAYDVVTRSAFPSGQGLDPDGTPRPNARVPVPADDVYRRLADRMGPGAVVTSVVVESGARAYATTVQDQVGQVWDVTDAINPEVMHVFGGPVSRIAFDPVGADRIVTASPLAEVALWDWVPSAPKGQQARQRSRLTKHDRPLNGLGFSQDGGTAITYDDAGVIRLYDLADPAQPHRIAELRTAQDVTAVALSADRGVLAAGLANGVLRIWDVTSPGDPRSRVSRKVHPDAIRALAFRPGGAPALVTVGEYNRVMLWDVADTAAPRELARISGGTAGVNGAAFGDTPSKVVTSNDDGTTRSWEFDFDVAVEAICGRVEAHISREEWSQYVESVSGALDYRRPCE
ncbi:helix-turn-helix domain-containing protein [Saccharothrix longispora]|uniref:Energy-coupling factor transporter ATP-binding protein EcfA2 n=1 Tax=Saccharothrix longispora TaxID=33920 RepID=A0ABU1PN63_9PSEU|nr:helix-turn-helix domain-containing protein [Saccharothrix longispora]MDR6592112.1 energy-coupling factor transporter ATP-binding protein EcfA2 [Saccharothrix longispora]